MNSLQHYDPINPFEDSICSVFYSRPEDSAFLRTLCDNGECQCAEGGCPPTNPFEITKTFKLHERDTEMINYVCDNFDYVWKGQLLSLRRNGRFLEFYFEIDEVIKAGKLG
ncbi:venom factor [Trichonephila clavipes]|nr:venom factor [Trichonephila clavipes]